MCNQVPKYINENCPSCHPKDYTKSLAEFTGEVEEVTSINSDGSKELENEYLYKCVKCGARVWADERWVREHVVEVEAAIDKVKATRPNRNNDYYIWGFKTLSAEANFKCLREMFNEDAEIFTKVLNKLSK